MKKTLNNITLIRHSRDDHSYIDDENDTSLTPLGIELAYNSSNDLIEYLEGQSFNRVVVYSSSRKRAIETATILFKVLSSRSIEHILRIDGRLRELHQGTIMNINKSSYTEKANKLEKEWKLFDYERLRGNYSYKFGQPSPRDPRAIFIATPYGESQADLSTRVRAALGDIIESAMASKTAVIVITHRGVIREMFNIVSSVNNHVPLTQYLENEMMGWGYCIPTTLNIDDVDFVVDSIKQTNI